jgi:DNA/RNA-binding domain of Phe-tRNA-synthetase-like protein
LIAWEGAELQGAAVRDVRDGERRGSGCAAARSSIGQTPSQGYRSIGRSPYNTDPVTSPQDDSVRATSAGASTDPAEWLAAATVDAAVFYLRPDYRALLLAVDGLLGGTSDAVSEDILADAEVAARRRLAGKRPHQLPHVAAWREGYRAFGAKPQRTRPSVEALLRRLDSAGLPRIDRITDVYNAVSIAHMLPIGGEDRAAYLGPPRLVRAVGSEPFDTTAGGDPVVEHPEPGEVVWRDQGGVTCRRWNWRQCTRTRITTETSSAVFILDALDPFTDDAVYSAADALADGLRALSADATIHRRLLTHADRNDGGAPGHTR